MKLPHFRYHPDPIATGSVLKSDKTCLCCGHARGHIYAWSPYCQTDLDHETICPWCIANGSAHAKYDASFVRGGDFPDDAPAWAKVPRQVSQEIEYRTPGFCGWQEERWWAHCEDAGEFIGLADAKQVLAHGKATIEILRQDLGWDADSDFDDYIQSLSKEGQPTAYLFRCRHCGLVGGYTDFT